MTAHDINILLIVSLRYWNLNYHFIIIDHSNWQPSLSLPAGHCSKAGNQGNELRRLDTTYVTDSLQRTVCGVQWQNKLSSKCSHIDLIYLPQDSKEIRKKRRVYVYIYRYIHMYIYIFFLKYPFASVDTNLFSLENHIVCSSLWKKIDK